MLDRSRKREYCEILGVSTEANEKIIKKAYHKMALELHPDRPHNRGKEGIELKFKQVADAYENLTSGNQALNSLKNSLKSEDIHSSLEHFFFTTKSNGSSLNNFKFNSMSASDFTNGGSNSGTFSRNASLHHTLDAKLPNFTSQGSLSSGSLKLPTTILQPEKLPKKGQSLKTTLRVSFDESVVGCTKILEFTRSLTCKSCSGSGSISSFAQNCRDCHGMGSLNAVINGTSVITTCPSCSNSAEVKDKWCSACGGKGKTTSKKTCMVDVPAGIIQGTTKVFQGQGDEGMNGGEPGDFIVCYEVEEHPFFRRDGPNVYCSLEISFPQAVLGSKIQVLSIYGKTIDIQLEPGVQPNQLIKVKGEGFLVENRVKGDLFIQVIVTVPTNINSEEKELLERLSVHPNFQFTALQK